MRLGGLGLVQMKALRIELAREVDDVLFREGLPAELDIGADLQILEIAGEGTGAALGRHARQGVGGMGNFRLRRGLRDFGQRARGIARRDQLRMLLARNDLALLVQRLDLHRDEPHFRAVARYALVQDRAAQRQPVAWTQRLFPAQFVDPRRAERGGARQPLIEIDPHHQGAGVPARGAEPAEHRMLRGFLVEMEGLRIVGGREPDDLVFRDRVIRMELGDRAGNEIFVVIFGHGRPDRRLRAGSPSISPRARGCKHFSPSDCGEQA